MIPKTVPANPSLETPTNLLMALLQAQQETNQLLKVFHRDMTFIGVVYLISVALTFCSALMTLR